jgi:hypothetical protein
VPQGSVLGPLLFVIYINDLPESVKFFPCKLYADDSKILAEIKDESDALKLQQDIDSIVNWSDTWLMRLNYEKCKVMHIGKRNPGHKFTMQDTLANTIVTLTVTETERDLGHHIVLGRQVEQSCSDSGSDIEQLTRLDEERVHVQRRRLVAQVVQDVHSSSPRINCTGVEPVYMRADINRLERVQRQATRVSHRMKSHDYPTRLNMLQLKTLEERRKRGDLIQFFKLVDGIEEVRWRRRQVTIPPGRGHRLRYERELVSNCGQRYNFCINRVVNEWNKLPDWVVKFSPLDSHPVNSFKNAFDRYKLGTTA